ncbi:MAG: ATP-dependent helicase HrpB [Gammaproteobacteria bacterium]
MTFHFDQPLPVDGILDPLCDALETVGAAVVQAPPGAGKTTRVPLALLDARWRQGGRIVMLEPRRLAARAAARHMAALLGEAVGETVGYRVRLDTRVGPHTRIEVVTEGVLTRLLQRDPGLEGVAAVIFDECHERNLQADLGLALCLESRAALRPDLRLLAMSATVDGTAAAELLGGAPVLVSEGRSHPVTVRHFAAPAAAPPESRGLAAAVAAAAVTALQEESGSLLVFLPGAREIRATAAALAARLPGDVLLAPLYGDLGAEDQEAAIRPAPPGRRKVVLATNIAETSLTIDGIGVVIDAGLTRVSRFEPRSGMTRLVTVPVSQASAAQRCGRAGRTGPGACYRLWGAAHHRRLAPYNRAEILDADLAPLALELCQWGEADPARLSWLDRPPAAHLAQARDLLVLLGAVDDANGRITVHGRRMAELALHPRLAHMVLKGIELGVGGLACALAALLSERDIVRGASRDADLRGRLELLRHGSGAEADPGAVRQVQRAAQQWRRQLEIPEPAWTDRDLRLTGVLLGFAYPDRIAQRRPGGDNRFLLANGRGAVFAGPDPLAASDYVVAAHLDAGGREARIFLAAPVTAAELLEHFGDRLQTTEFVRWDPREQAVSARSQERLGALVLSDEPLAAPDPDAVCRAMLDGVRALGLDALPWSKRLRAWQQRLVFLHRLQPQQWPDVSDPALLAGLDQWLAPFLGGVSRAGQLAKLDLGAALNALLPWERQRALDELAPTHVTVPSGSRIAIDYSGDEPVLAVRLQEMFGTTDTPRIAGGSVPLLLHLLSPAGRPVQVTRSLASFWEHAYFEVKKDLKGRYPKHHWPDDPLQAEPTARARRRS